MRLGARFIATLFATALLIAIGGQASAHHKDGHDGRPTHGCDQATENDGDAYDSTCDGETSTRGGHVDGSEGAADNKNPAGQAPNGTDSNNGYECDGNNGHPNPAHTGCPTPAPTPPPTCEDTDTCPKPPNCKERHGDDCVKPKPPIVCAGCPGPPNRIERCDVKPRYCNVLPKTGFDLTAFLLLGAGLVIAGGVGAVPDVGAAHEVATP